MPRFNVKCFDWFTLTKIEGLILRTGECFVRGGFKYFGYLLIFDWILDEKHHVTFMYIISHCTATII